MGIHESAIHNVFNDRSMGSDLEFAEIKTNRQSTRPKFYVKPKDFRVRFFIFYDFVSQMGYMCRTRDFKKLDDSKKATSIYLAEVIQKAIFSTSSLMELKEFYEQKMGIKNNE